MHERFATLMSLYLDGIATRGELLELAQHLDACPTCEVMWERWQAVDRLLSTTPSAVPSRGLAEGVSQRLSQLSSHESGTGWLTLGVLVVGLLSLATSGLWIMWLLWWGWRHPLELAAVLSAGAQMLSGVSWILVGTQTLMASIGGPGPTALLAFCTIGAAGLLASWIWVAALAGHSRHSTPAGLPTRTRMLR